MEVVRARKLGFCFGVRRAVEMVERLGRKEGLVETLGTIVHNPQVVERLAGQGIRVAETLDEARGRVVAITAHGVGPQVEEEIRRRGFRLIDATCPMVKKVHLVARELAEADFDVLIFGDPDHQEVQGVLGWAGQRALATTQWPPPGGHKLAWRRIALLSQTTQPLAAYRQFVQKVLDSHLGRAREVRILNTICGVTDEQRKAAQELAGGVDLMLVVGGGTSANTRHLAEASAATGVETHHIETAAEIEPAWLQGKKRVGVTAGTSTPDWVVEEVVAALEAAGGEPGL